MMSDDVIGLKSESVMDNDDVLISNVSREFYKEYNPIINMEMTHQE